ncbi:zinc-binding alcohol dehydrogenase family protein [Candidatus Berkiella aquae]|uniref:Alcohol dehydrogenase n=1 Tax=Candidatus Berkiella aquae TaxID=295108 RepID=A0A0Q9YLI3_9GAMM|nr:zinc-dependent alcohol dehydrogenase family protein [Candidatus Berkiella aquae]MCS5711478.1 zinc-dependent alcohol dehydrogenase family protein [Candidatus Berkiella aquae]
MRAMVFNKMGEKLKLQEVRIPTPSETELLIRVSACGLCRTDLHIIDGELNKPKLPLIPGHQIVGIVEELGSAVEGFKIGQRVGVPWLGGSCGHCFYCGQGQENLCDDAQYTGYQLNGGLAEYCVANSQFCFPVPENYPDLQVAPLFCAGLIGYRALSKIATAQRIGFYGFGASAHILSQLAVYQGKEVYAFVKKGDAKGQEFARSLGAVWAGNSEEIAPTALDAAIIFAPDGCLIPLALKNIRKGGTVVCAGIHMSDIPSFPYEILWGERHVCSVANLTRKDGEEFLKIAPQVPIKTQVNVYPLEKANEALEDLRMGRFSGAAVIQIS